MAMTKGREGIAEDNSRGDNSDDKGREQGIGDGEAREEV